MSKIKQELWNRNTYAAVMSSHFPATPNAYRAAVVANAAILKMIKSCRDKDDRS